jgi:hypothetical protein
MMLKKGILWSHTDCTEKAALDTIDPSEMGAARMKNCRSTVLNMRPNLRLKKMHQLTNSVEPLHSEQRAQPPRGLSMQGINRLSHSELAVKEYTQNPKWVAEGVGSGQYMHTLLSRIEGHPIGPSPGVQFSLAPGTTLHDFIITSGILKELVRIEVICKYDVLKFSVFYGLGGILKEDVP